MIKEVTMYRLVCDEPDCPRSPSDEGDYAGWASVGACWDELDDCDCWYVNDDQTRLLCPQHAPPWCETCDENHEGECACDPVSPLSGNTPERTQR